ncbi:ATP-NAD kinase-like domain-containing protein [Dipodascopsis uninucleata]
MSSGSKIPDNGDYIKINDENIKIFDIVLASSSLVAWIDESTEEQSEHLKVSYVDDSNISKDPRLQTRFIEELPDYLDPEKSSISVICSVTAGKRKSRQVFKNLVEPLLRSLNIPYNYIPTLSSSTIKDYAAELHRNVEPEKILTVIILSGDTSISELVNGLSTAQDSRKLVLLPIPTGSGNALMTSLGITSPAVAVKSMVNTEPRPLKYMGVEFPQDSIEILPPTDDTPEGATAPVFTAKPQPIAALVVASWALHAALVGDSDSPEYRKLGNERFQRAAQANLERNVPWNGSIKYHSPDNLEEVSVIEGPHSYVLATSVSSLEPGFLISPEGKPLSGRLFLIEIPYLEPNEVFRLVMLAYQNGRHVNEPTVVYKEISDAVIAVEEDEDRMRRFCIDGRIIMVPNKSTVKLESKENIFRNWYLYII